MAIAVGLLLLVALGEPARAGPGFGGQSTCSLQLMSGNGPVGGQDTFNEFSDNGGATWQPSSLIIAPVVNPVGVQVWANPLPGTEWIVGDLNVFYNGPAKTIYRTIFTPPQLPTSSTAAVTVQVHADNAVAVALNGQQIGAQTVGAIPANFQGPPDVFVSSAPLNSGANEMRFSVSNIDSAQGFDYLATIEYDCAGPPAGCVSAPSGLQAWWPLDETTGATMLTDVSGGGHSGAAQQAAVGPVGPPPVGPAPSTAPFVSPPAKVGGSLYFYTEQTYGQVPHNAPLEPGGGDFTIDGWAYPIQVGPGFVQPIVDKFDAATNTGYALYIESPGIANNAHLNLAYGDGSLSQVVQTISPLSYEQWHHVAITIERTAAPPPGGHYLEVRLYVNGAQEGIQQVGNPVGSIANGLPLLLGGTRLSPPLGFGEIALDDVQVYDRALSASEIAAIFNAGTAGKCTPTPPPASTATPTPSPRVTLTPGQTPTPTPTKTPTPAPIAPCGDVNADGSVNAIDAQLLLQVVSGLLPAVTNPAGADVNGDSRVNAIDAQLVLQYSAGFNVLLGC